VAKSKVQEFLENIKQDIKESVSPANIWNDIKTELTQQAAHGSHEVAAALFNGSAFVMYPRSGENEQSKDQAPLHGLPAEADKQPEVQKEQERGMEL
jgi:hypothetical protein